MKIALIAGEASGDKLGGNLMAALLRQRPEVSCVGIGGPHMEALGLRSWFPMQELSLMGFAEILPHIRRLKQRIRETVEQVEREVPDVLVTIDSPGFNYRVVKQLRKRGKVCPRFMHYVAPTVWAYKPKRAEKTATLFDHLLVVLPFEPPYFEKHGLKTTFVGHRVVEEPVDADAGARFRAQHGIDKGELLLAVMPGSRKGELEVLLPVFAEAVRQFHMSLRTQQSNKDIKIVLPATLHSARLMEAFAQHWPVSPVIVTDEDDKKAAMQAADLGLAKSGTVTLEAAKAGLPMITAYKVSPLSAWVLRRMILTKYVSLVNIIEQEEIIPELLQERCTPGHLAEALIALSKDKERQAWQREHYTQALAKLAAPEAGKTPSQVAAEIVLSQVTSV